ncbi:hypothetical protein GM661_18700 [Iocasia frigidifontis]|uniref:Uncharacterized protein n=1 Tax=Iocasia fonsfrigidae TaxID=2682810 RepID=A0A8A7KJQ7_9FIRM|nr:hypothetical protein [Iocasia fonsfrigidae]QTL99839.1 hypothetical protein GM661_18700 [Iocasia fonsfrigidae]
MEKNQEQLERVKENAARYPYSEIVLQVHHGQITKMETKIKENFSNK